MNFYFQLDEANIMLSNQSFFFLIVSMTCRILILIDWTEFHQWKPRINHWISREIPTETSLNVILWLFEIQKQITVFKFYLHEIKCFFLCAGILYYFQLIKLSWYIHQVLKFLKFILTWVTSLKLLHVFKEIKNLWV